MKRLSFLGATAIAVASVGRSDARPWRLGFSRHGAIGAIANLDGFVTFVR